MSLLFKHCILYMYIINILRDLRENFACTTKACFFLKASFRQSKNRS